MKFNTDTDKDYWHGYLNYYEENVFKNLPDVPFIMEFGVLQGASIRYFQSRFPRANIFGVDIMQQQDEWPTGEKIKYFNCDQGNRDKIKEMVEKIYHGFNLVIDDGSHQPEHQYNCLVECLPWMNIGGYYIIEDVHTAFEQSVQKPNIFNLLLAVEHKWRLGLLPTPALLHSFCSKNSYMVEDEVQYLFRAISDIKLFKRTVLPERCWVCKSSAFDYTTLKCTCGADLYSEYDSMAFILRR